MDQVLTKLHYKDALHLKLVQMLIIYHKIAEIK